VKHLNTVCRETFLKPLFSGMLLIMGDGELFIKQMFVIYVNDEVTQGRY